jgi:hypothetical protein
MAEGMESGARGADTETGDRTAADDDRAAQADALALYALLPSAARASLTALLRLSTPAEREALGHATARMIAQIGFDVARRTMADTMARRFGDGFPASEQEIADEAVRIVREARGGLTASVPQRMPQPGKDH